MRRLALAVVLAVAAAGLATPSIAAPGSTAPGDELPPEQDNGKDGRNTFQNAGHTRPVEACKDELTDTPASLVLRVLPRGPVQPDGSLAFTSGVCVYLPPGYVSSGLEYPVLYLLHGGGGDHADWVTFGGIRQMMDDATAADPTRAAIVVMPDGNDGQWYDSLDGSNRTEEYVLDYVVPYVDRHFRTIADRTGRVIDGLSNGGYGAMHLAAKGPDRFVAAGGMSSNLGGRTFDGWGNAIESPAYGHGSTPADLVPNLDGIDLTLDIGASCAKDMSRDLCATFAFEQFFLLDNRYFVGQLDAQRRPGDGIYEYRETEGGHNWGWWPLWLRERHLPFLLARAADPRPTSESTAPSGPRPGFRFRSIAANFTAWGYDVTVDRDVREFLDLRDVTPSGMEVQGSGSATIRTAPVYRPHRRYAVTGGTATPQNVTADRNGRLTFVVDLGPTHQYEQYSPQAQALAAAGDYWAVRRLQITSTR